MARSAIVLVEGTRLALIKRLAPWHDGPYYLFPGGSVEAGETPAEAAIREAEEELGLVVWVERLLATGHNQSYYLAKSIGGTFGSGTAAELFFDREDPDGTWTPTWIDLHDLPALDVRPKSLALWLCAGMLLEPDTVLEIAD